MEKAVSAADANRRFSELLRTVKKGRSVIVTSHGKPVAKITPVVMFCTDSKLPQIPPVASWISSASRIRSAFWS